MRFILLALAVLATASPANAEPATSVTLTVTSADFVSPAARARLERRIGTAVEQVCGSYASVESYDVSEMNACWMSARDQAKQQLGRVDSLALAASANGISLVLRSR